MERRHNTSLCNSTPCCYKHVNHQLKGAFVNLLQSKTFLKINNHETDTNWYLHTNVLLYIYKYLLLVLQ